jgi:hypothetical protein
MNQHEWVRGCLTYYEEQGLTPEPGGEWQEAHYPAPKGAGNNTIWLMHDHHQVQGLLQSEEYGRQCFYNYETLNFLKEGLFVSGWFDLWDLYDKWKGHNGKSQIGKCNSHPNTTEARSRTGKVTVESMLAHPNTISSRSRTVKEMLVHPNTIENQRCEAMNSHPNTREGRVRGGKKSGVTNGPKNVGSMLPYTSDNAKKTNSQRWQCLVTGHINNPGGLTRYQKRRGIDTALRVRLED